jgi:hypothetical protein
MDSDPNPDIFVIDLQDANKIPTYYFLKVHLHHFSKLKSPKEVTKQYRRNQGFSYFFCLLIEGSGSILLTNGSGSGRPKNMWIRNTVKYICIRPYLLLLFTPLKKALNWKDTRYYCQCCDNFIRGKGML